MATAVGKDTAYDARIAACLRVHCVTRLLTFDMKDFARYSGFAAVDPAQI